MKSIDDSLKKAFLPGQLALKYHPLYRGKIEIVPKCPIRSFDDFAVWYTAGAAEACNSIKRARGGFREYEQAEYDPT